MSVGLVTNIRYAETHKTINLWKLDLHVNSILHCVLCRRFSKSTFGAKNNTEKSTRCIDIYIHSKYWSWQTLKLFWFDLNLFTGQRGFHTFSYIHTHTSLHCMFEVHRTRVAEVGSFLAIAKMAKKFSSAVYLLFS